MKKDAIDMKYLLLVSSFRKLNYLALSKAKKLAITFTCLIVLTTISLSQYAGKAESNTNQVPELIRFYVPNGPYDEDNSNRIIFHESSGRSQLNSKQSCAVEAAARNNPDRPVQLFMLSNPAFDYESRWLEVLSRYPNVRVVLVNEEDYFKNTPLENWFVKGEWRTSPYKKIHLSDYLRMTTLFKGGGLYLDLDILVLKRLDTDELKNFFVIEEPASTLICNSVLHLEKSHRFTEMIIRYLEAEYEPKEWGFHGGEIITAIMRYYCDFREKQLPASNGCSDVKLFNYTSFFPVIPEEYGVMFQAATQRTLSLFHDSYGVHIWNSKSHNDFLDFTSNQLYSHLAREHCPFTVAKSDVVCQ